MPHPSRIKRKALFHDPSPEVTPSKCPRWNKTIQVCCDEQITTKLTHNIYLIDPGPNPTEKCRKTRHVMLCPPHTPTKHCRPCCHQLWWHVPVPAAQLRLHDSPFIPARCSHLLSIL